MFSIFHLLQLIGIVVGLVMGVTMGGGRFGIIGAIVGGAIGLVFGYVAGRTPLVLTFIWMRRDLKRATVEELRERVANEYYISHLLIAELASRGESIDDLRGVVADQLHSTSPYIRQFGEVTARLWFPDLAETEQQEPNQRMHQTPDGAGDP